MLEVNELGVTFKTHEGIVRAINGVSFGLEKGKTLGIVGESGSGKTQTVMAIMGLLAENASVTGSIKFEGQELVGMTPRELNQIRGRSMTMIFQDPMTSLNPYLTIENQMCEVLTTRGSSKKEAKSEALRVLDAVKIPNAKSRISFYPHEFSGGMRQRVMIAMALLSKPSFLVADEPTTALDVTVQAQILHLLKELQEDIQMGVIFITHDLGVVANICDDVLVMYGGRTMEHAPTSVLFKDAKHPYTQGLLGALPRLDEKPDRLPSIPGYPPNLLHLPKGCPFYERCQKHLDVCKDVLPQKHHVADYHDVACHLMETQL